MIIPGDGRFNRETEARCATARFAYGTLPFDELRVATANDLQFGAVSCRADAYRPVL